MASSNKSSPSDIPGEGWTNSSLPQQMFPVMTQEGRVTLYSTQRRLIHTSSGHSSSWSRTGNSDPNDAIAKSSSTATGGGGGGGCDFSSTKSSSPEEQAKQATTIKALICQLSESFYAKGWQVGTGGGISMRMGDGSPTNPYRVFSTPSGLQKEDMVGNDIFELDIDQSIINQPMTSNLKLSSMTPLWFIIYKLRPSTQCIIHTHSINALLATLLDPTEKIKTLKITDLEMIKGVGNHAYNDLLEIPIIENQTSEDKLGPDLAVAISSYPKTNAVLVRRHGVYVWGDSWEEAKTQLECFDYLFQTAVEMKKLSIDCGIKPWHSISRVENGENGANATNNAIETNHSRSQTAVSLQSTTPLNPTANTTSFDFGNGFFPSSSWSQPDYTLPYTYLTQFPFFPTSYSSNNTGVYAGDAYTLATVADHQNQKRRKSNNTTAIPIPGEKLKSTTSLPSSHPSLYPPHRQQQPMIKKLSSKNSIPVIPRDAQTLILSLTGCIVPSNFFRDYTYPFILNNVDSYIDNLAPLQLSSLINKFHVDTSAFANLNVSTTKTIESSNEDTKNGSISTQRTVMKAYIKAKIKYNVNDNEFQDLLSDVMSWTGGTPEDQERQKQLEKLFDLIYSDVEEFLRYCEKHGVKVHLYSSESIYMQKMILMNSKSRNENGTGGWISNKNIESYFVSLHDAMTIGPTNVSTSFSKLKILLKHENDWNKVVYLSESKEALEAAVGSGLGYPVLCRRSQFVGLAEEKSPFPILKGLGLMALTGESKMTGENE